MQGNQAMQKLTTAIFLTRKEKFEVDIWYLDKKIIELAINFDPKLDVVHGGSMASNRGEKNKLANDSHTSLSVRAVKR